MPEVDEHQPVLPEQTREVETAVGGDVAVVGKAADTREFRELRPCTVRTLQQPDLARLEEAECEAAVGRIDEAHHLRARTVGADGWHLEEQREAVSVE